MPAVARPGHSRIEAELLLVDPVGHTVDNAVQLAVGGNLLLRGAVGEVDVVVAHEGNAPAVGREHRHAHLAVGRQRSDAVVFHLIYIIFGLILIKWIIVFFSLNI